MPNSHHTSVLSSLSVQGLIIPERAAVGLLGLQNCVLEAGMPLDMREKLLQLHVAKSQGALLLHGCKGKFTLEKTCRERLPPC